jgi:signal transduction histidine kinase
MRSNKISNSNAIINFVVIGTGLFFALLFGSIVYFVVLYRNKQQKNEREQEELQANFRQELLKTQLEVQEQTLNYISAEIHDNITQILSFVKLSLGNITSGKEGDRKTKITEARELVAQSITDLRDLSKSLSFEHIASQGLIRTIATEVERINKSGLLAISLEQEGCFYSLDEQRELVLFRIFQESLNNTLKHSNARHLKILLQYHTDLFILTLEDDGSGFSAETLENKSGSGLRNIENRAALIGGTATIDSSPGKGCNIKVALNPLKQQLY